MIPGNTATNVLKKQASWYRHRHEEAAKALQDPTLTDDEYDSHRDQSEYWRGAWEQSAKIRAEILEQHVPRTVVTVDRKPVAWFKSEEDAKLWTDDLRAEGLNAYWKVEES